MIQTLTALICAHILADFLFQTSWMAQNKSRALPLLAHIGTVLALGFIALGGALQVAAFVALLHLIIDYTKARIGRDDIAAFLTDQSAHIASIGLAVWLWPQAFAGGIWVETPLAPEVMTLIGGFILTTRAGQFLVGRLMAPHAAEIHEEDGLENGGAVIGLLERGLTFLLVWAGQPAGVGLLMAAKSFLRVGSANESRKMAEYVIIGTLASIAWALATSYGTLAWLEILATAP